MKKRLSAIRTLIGRRHISSLLCNKGFEFFKHEANVVLNFLLCNQKEIKSYNNIETKLIKWICILGMARLLSANGSRIIVSPSMQKGRLQIFLCTNIISSNKDFDKKERFYFLNVIRVT